MAGEGDPLWVRGAVAAIAFFAPFSVGSLVYLRAADVQRFDERCEQVRRELDQIHALTGRHGQRLDAVADALSGVVVEAKRNAAGVSEMKSEFHALERRFRTGGGM